MNAFFQAIGRFFRSLFGGGTKEPAEAPEVPATPPETPVEPTTEPPSSPEAPPAVPTEEAPITPAVTGEDEPLAASALLVLKRDAGSGTEITGKLYLNGEFCCFTLENGQNHVPAGTYALTLRTKGGLHATYGYKYGDIHKGVLQLETSGNEFAFLRSGNSSSDANGGIVLGSSIEATGTGTEVWHSDEAYRKLYPPVAEKLAVGEAVSVEIKE